MNTKILLNLLGLGINFVKKIELKYMPPKNKIDIDIKNLDTNGCYFIENDFGIINLYDGETFLFCCDCLPLQKENSKNIKVYETGIDNLYLIDDLKYIYAYEFDLK